MRGRFGGTTAPRALHDLGHVRQIAELVRVRKYLAGGGPLGAEYRLSP